MSVDGCREEINILSTPTDLLKHLQHTFIHPWTTAFSPRSRIPQENGIWLPPVALIWKKSPLGLCVWSQLHAGLHLSSQRCTWTQESCFELSPHVFVMQLLAQLLRYFPPTSKCPKRPFLRRRLLNLSSLLWHKSLVAVKNVRAQPNDSFIAVRALVCGSHLPLFLLSRWGRWNKWNQCFLLWFSIQA